MLRNLLALVAFALMLLPVAGFAGSTPAQKCAVAKNKAASKKTAAKLKCWQKAIATGQSAADSLCLTAAEGKFHSAIVKAESHGGCAVSGDEADIENAVDTCVTSIVNLTPATTTTTSAASSTTTTSSASSTTTTSGASSTTTTPSSSTTTTTAVACDPLTQNCPAGEGCYPNGPGGGACETAGAGGQSTMCQTNSDCAPGFTCVNNGTNNTCDKLCRLSASSCPSGTSCVAPNGFPPDTGVCI